MDPFQNFTPQFIPLQLQNQTQASILNSAKCSRQLIQFIFSYCVILLGLLAPIPIFIKDYSTIDRFLLGISFIFFFSSVCSILFINESSIASRYQQLFDYILGDFETAKLLVSWISISTTLKKRRFHKCYQKDDPQSNKEIEPLVKTDYDNLTNDKMLEKNAQTTKQSMETDATFAIIKTVQMLTFRMITLIITISILLTLLSVIIYSIGYGTVAIPMILATATGTIACIFWLRSSKCKTLDQLHNLMPQIESLKREAEKIHAEKISQKDNSDKIELEEQKPFLGIRFPFALPFQSKGKENEKDVDDYQEHSLDEEV